MKTMSEYLMDQAIQYKPLPPDEQSALVQRAQRGDQDAREQLVLCNLRLVIYVFLTAMRKLRRAAGVKVEKVKAS
jgi:DNA-directed RNA polymerase sigma subunit (sigma70/sigma32)